MPKKKPKDGRPQVHEDLNGFEVEINEFGEISSNMPIDKLNKFLNREVDDKKLRDRDLEEMEPSDKSKEKSADAVKDAVAEEKVDEAIEEKGKDEEEE